MAIITTRINNLIACSIRFFLFGLPVLFLVVSCQRPKETKEPRIAAEIEIPEPKLYFGIAIDSLDVYEGKIRWNQTLSDLLEDFNVTGEQLYEVSIRAKNVYDVRYLKAGFGYSVIHSRDSLQTARAFVFEPDARSYVIYHFGDSVYAEKVDKQVVRREKSIAATIEAGSNVYFAVRDAGGSQLLVHKLVDILAWQVAFMHIQAGDKFKVIYEEELVDGEPVGISKVIGVHFEHQGESYYGIHYDAGGEEDYFDQYGNSLRKVFLKAPLDYKRISSGFTYRRFHPVQKRYKAHLGTDYAASPGTEIRTVGDGVVVEAAYGKYNGNYVKIKHNSNYSTQYLHMQKIKTGIRPGVKVKQGQTIGYVGSTGLARGPHLCFRFWKNGRQVNSETVDLPPSEPIKASELAPFLHQKNNILHRLDLIAHDEGRPGVAGEPAQP